MRLLPLRDDRDQQMRIILPSGEEHAFLRSLNSGVPEPDAKTDPSPELPPAEIRTAAALPIRQIQAIQTRSLREQIVTPHSTPAVSPTVPIAAKM